MRTQEEEIMKTVNGFVVAEELDDLYRKTPKRPRL